MSTQDKLRGTGAALEGFEDKIVAQMRTWMVGTLVGISMFFSGLTRLMLSMAVRRIAA
jgi:hypothetical protein